MRNYHLSGSENNARLVCIIEKCENRGVIIFIFQISAVYYSIVNANLKVGSGLNPRTKY